MNFCEFLCSLTTSNTNATYVNIDFFFYWHSNSITLTSYSKVNNVQQNYHLSSLHFISRLFAESSIRSVFFLEGNEKITDMIAKNYSPLASFEVHWSWFSVKYAGKSSHYRRCTLRSIFLHWIKRLYRINIKAQEKILSFIL